MRVKRGTTKKAKHKKVLNQTKGFRLSYSKLYKRAKEALLHAGQYSFSHRKKRKSQFRRLWIERISAGLSRHDMSYSKFIDALNKKNIKLNRKMLAELSLNNQDVFDKVVESVS